MARYTHSTPPQAARSSRSGCLPRFLLPPISVIVIGSVFSLVLSQIQVDIAETAPRPSSVDDNPGISPVFTPEVQAWEEKILRWGERYQVDPDLIATVMQIESCGGHQALSPAGAVGLFQVMPYHFTDNEDPYQVGTNARRGLSYLRQSLEKGGSIRLALAGYNGGIQGAQRPETEWPDETKRYVYWGMGIYQDAKDGKKNSSRLEEWLASGGKTLCQQAR